jgi:hypothetical protein
LDGASNFLSSKVRVTLLLEENDIWDILKDVVTPSTNPHQLAAHNKEVKAKRMIMDVVDHLFLLGVNSMYHEVVYLGVQLFLRLLLLQGNFCPRHVLL